MEPLALSKFFDRIVSGEVDHAKGNRLLSGEYS